MKYLALKRQKEALLFRTGTTLDAGSGIYPLPNALHVDIDNKTNPDCQADLSKGFPFADNTFDTIMALEIIEHLHTLEQINFMMEAWRCLKPEGKLILSFPNANGTIGWLNKVQWAIREKTTERKYHTNKLIHTHIGVMKHQWFEGVLTKLMKYKIGFSKRFMLYDWIVVAVKFGTSTEAS